MDMDIDVDSEPPTEPLDSSNSNQRPFRLHAKKLALTYPQCETTPARALVLILQRWGPDVKWAVVGQEKHLDGHDHLHVAIWLKTAFDTTSTSSLDFIGGGHGNYQTMRDPPAWVAYCIKGGNWVATPGFDPVAYIASRKKKTSVSFEIVAKKLKSGETLKAINDVHPGFVLQHLAKVKVYETFIVGTERPAVEQWPPCPSPAVRSTFTLTECSILDWLHANVISGDDRIFKQAQLMIIGRSGVGKSSFTMALRRYCRIYDLPMDEGFYDAFTNDGYDVILMDEYRSQKTIQFLNAFVQGSPIYLRVKGGQYLKKKNLPVILLSNYEPASSYHKVQRDNPEVLDAFMSRWFVVRILGGETLYTLTDWLNCA